MAVNIGVAVYPYHGRDGKSVLASASDASRVAKQSGKNRVSMLERAALTRNRENAELQTELRAALEADQFVLHYQPVVDVESGEVVGAEALLRWNHPQRGMIRPADFIELAEQAGLMPEIGLWVLREALAQASSWTRRNEDFRIAVNVSGTQFRDPSFVDAVLAELVAADVPADRLVIELTERHQVGEERDEVRALQRLSDCGIGIAIDDFGTGHSMMKYLDSLPVTGIKLDQHLIASATADPRDSLIVEALISLAHGLGLDVVAEGVETEGQLEFLRRVGCDSYQGYYYRMPLGKAAFDALMLESTAA
jgi:EAL domain-containing protein (putative c-di-GMP-specific phosphodiesterase class I)